MSERELVGIERLRAFLEALGREFRHPARLYLSGGEGLVWRGLRGTTGDVDVTFEVDDRHHGEWLRVLRELIIRTDTSVEEASPADFIPLPPGAASRAEFAGRFGSIDVYLYDVYSVALSKLSRGHARDLNDVRSLIAAGLVIPSELRRMFEAVFPAYAGRAIHADPVRFRAALDLVVPAT